nr:hypothetical protein [Natronococcus amylolyticus]
MNGGDDFGDFGWVCAIYGEHTRRVLHVVGVVAASVSISGGGVDANSREETGADDVFDAVPGKDVVEAGISEAVGRRLRDEILVVSNVDIVDDLGILGPPCEHGRVLSRLDVACVNNRRVGLPCGVEDPLAVLEDSVAIGDIPRTVFLEVLSLEVNHYDSRVVTDYVRNTK